MTFFDCPLDKILVNRPERQRSEIDTGGLYESIARNGVLNPAIVQESHEQPGFYILIAGERRLTCCQELNLPSIPVRLMSDLSPAEAQILELEENVKRDELPWQDEVKAITNIHHLYLERNTSWGIEDTAREVSYSVRSLRKVFTVHEMLGDSEVSEASSLSAALTILERRKERALDNIVEQIAKKTKEIKQKAEPATTIAPVALFTNLVECVDFLRWAPLYSGPPFNFLHCDFPYGMNFNFGKQGNHTSWESYDDSEDVFWTLLKCLAEHRSTLFTQSAHMMFWYSLKHHAKLLEFFQSEMPEFSVNPFPLIWGKSDHVGILPDASRYPRQIYETALMLTKGDRKIVRPVDNCIFAPTSKKIHNSEKPIPVLNHFFKMFVDENTRMLDPTAGSGNALQSAEGLGAEGIVGLEMNKSFVEAANREIHNARALRRAAT